MKYNSLSIWEVAEIDKLEHLLAARLAIVAGKLAQGISDQGPMSADIGKRLKNDGDEIIRLKEIYDAVKEAKNCSYKVCDFFQAEKQEMEEEIEYKWRENIDRAIENGETQSILPVIAELFYELIKGKHKPSDTEALYRSLREMKKINERVNAQHKE